jgi:hypothetical protein
VEKSHSTDTVSSTSVDTGAAQHGAPAGVPCVALGIPRPQQIKQLTRPLALVTTIERVRFGSY